MSRHDKRHGSALAEKPAALPKNPPVTVVFPMENDTVTHPTYTIQIAANEAVESVEVRVDQEEWRPCRESLGLWWCDWSGYANGEHEITARLRRPDGTAGLSEVRSFEVKLG